MTVIIGMDPHKRSATIEIVDEQARVLAVGRYGTDRAGYAQMLAVGWRYPDRGWAVEAATASANTSPIVWSTTAKPCWTCR
jgi:transposase